MHKKIINTAIVLSALVFVSYVAITCYGISKGQGVLANQGEGRDIYARLGIAAFALSLISFTLHFLGKTVAATPKGVTLYLQSQVTLNYALFITAILTSYYFVAPLNFLAPGMPFGHFWDFYSLAIYAHQGTVDDVTGTGYLPLTILLGKIFSFMLRFSEPGGNIKIDFLFYSVYLAVFLTATGTLYAVCRRHIKDMSTRLVLLLIFVFSYPFIIEFERGNMVIISFIILALMLSVDRHSNMFLVLAAMFASLKILNLVIFAPIFLYCGWGRSFKAGGLFVAITVLSYLVLAYPMALDLNYARMPNTLRAMGPFPDFHQFAAHSDLYALYRGFALSFNSHTYDAFYQTFFKLAGVITGAFFLINYRKLDFDTFLFIIFIVVSMFLLFTTDMNLILLIPLLVLLLGRALAEKDNAWCLMIFILALPVLSLNTSPMVRLFDPPTKTYAYFSLRHILIPIQLAAILYTIYWYKIRGKSAAKA